MDPMHGNHNLDCPRETDLLRIISHGKKRLSVLQEIVGGPVRLRKLRRVVPECSKKVLIGLQESTGVFEAMGQYEITGVVVIDRF